MLERCRRITKIFSQILRCTLFILRLELILASLILLRSSKRLFRLKQRSPVYYFYSGSRFAPQSRSIIRTVTYFLFAKMKLKLKRKAQVTKNKLLSRNKQIRYIYYYNVQYYKKKYFICQKYYILCIKLRLAHQKKFTIKNTSRKLIHKHTANNGHDSAVNSV